MEANPVVFISYSHDSIDHQNKVFDLSKKLRSEGIDCILDQYEHSPEEGWPRWMQRNIKRADFVLMICTPIYYSRVMGFEEKGKGHGVSWEGNLIYQEMYDAGSLNNKFIPAFFKDGNHKNVPDPLKGSTSYNVDDDNEYLNLYKRFRGLAKEIPELGHLKQLIDLKQKTMFLSGLINPLQWEEANWTHGVNYLISPDGSNPPMMTILFENLEKGKEIFNNWLELIGNDDNNDQIRISIVTGDVPNQPFGYFISIGENVHNAKHRTNNYANDLNIEYFMTTSRVHRMAPQDLTNLENFIAEVKRFGYYYIVPAKELIDPEKGRGWSIEMDFKIKKKELNVRKFDEIPDKDDYESWLKSENVQNWKF